jgi:hypothetical protein
MVEDCFVLGTQVSAKTLAPLAPEEQQELIRLLKKITDEPV